MIPDRVLPLVFLGLSGLAGWAAHNLQVWVDTLRPEPGSAEARVFLPEPASIQVAVMDFDGIAADLMWVRTVLAFADIYDHRNAESARWLGVMLDTVTVLDPPWRTAYFYGGSMLRTIDDIEGSDRIFERGAEHIPSDAFFPFSIAMNAYLYRQDLERAVHYMHKAATLPNAPSWYRWASAAFLDRGGRRQAAMRYLEEQIRTEPDPTIRGQLVERYNGVLHDELSSQMEDARARYREGVGADVTRPEDLGTLPPDPLGGHWIIAADGKIRSDVREAALREKAARQERNILLRVWSR